MRFATCLLLVTLASGQASAALITTTFDSTTGREGNMFDLENISGVLVTLTGAFEGNFDTDDSGIVQIWYRLGTYVGHETDLDGWTLLGTAAYTSAGTDVPTGYDIGNTLLLTTGQVYGILMITSSAVQDVNYTDGSNVYSDGTLQITTGVGIAFTAQGAGQPPIDTTVFLSPRSWNGSIEYDAAAVPEPGTISLLAGGLAGLIWLRRRKG